ncbi:hypothetical protein V1477_002775 [Vespula maculifrons]|uniref:NADH dehydrogenase subunit 4L n=1 Tax=Vespula maculifrons TaxID=7453 RepID=A0ABD2CVP1_VESMC
MEGITMFNYIIRTREWNQAIYLLLLLSSSSSSSSLLLLLLLYYYYYSANKQIIRLLFNQG